MKAFNPKKHLEKQKVKGFFERELLPNDGLFGKQLEDLPKSVQEKINKAGYEDFGSFYDGYAYVRKKGEYGYLNDKGEEFVIGKYAQTYDFSNGYALVDKYNEEKEETEIGWVDTNFKEYKIGEYAMAFGFSNGMAKFIRQKELGQGEIGYLNINGEEKIYQGYDNLDRFIDGFALVHKNFGEVGFINTDGDYYNSDYFNKQDEKNNVNGFNWKIILTDVKNGKNLNIRGLLYPYSLVKAPDLRRHIQNNSELALGITLSEFSYIYYQNLSQHYPQLSTAEKYTELEPFMEHF